MTITIGRSTSLRIMCTHHGTRLRHVDFGYVYGEVGGASTSGGTFGPGAQDDEDDDDEEDDDDDESDD